MMTGATIPIEGVDALFRENSDAVKPHSGSRFRGEFAQKEMQIGMQIDQIMMFAQLHRTPELQSMSSDFIETY